MSVRSSTPKTMSEEARLAKNKQIREAGMATRARRSTMNCRVRDLKIVTNRINAQQETALRAVFLESKWVRNAALAAQRFDAVYAKELGGRVPVRLPDGSFELRSIDWLGSQMQQSAIRQLSSDIKSLAISKANGRKVGKLRFAREVSSIDLQQFGVTWNVDWKRSRVKIQNIPGWLPVRGLSQLRADGLELANAKLVQRADGWHLLATSFSPREEKVKKSGEIGVDFGVSTAFSFSDGSKVSAVVGESERLRRLQRKLSRQVKGSNGYRRTCERIQLEYLRASNRKDELANQLVSGLSGYSVFFQDEMISSWKRRGGGSHGSRKIQSGILGRVKSRLRQSGAVMLPRWVATTQWCADCGSLTKHGLAERVFLCSNCGFSEDRDTHAAKNMILLGNRYQFFTSGTEGSAGGGIVRLKEALYAPVEQFSVKPETVSSLASP